MKIDGHAHLWKPSEGFDILPITLNPDFARRDWLPEALAPELSALGIDRVVMTQSAPDIRETYSMLAHCRDLPYVAGVVGWADLAAAGRKDDVATLSADPKFLGLRLQLRRMVDDDYIRRPGVIAGLLSLAAHDKVAVLLAEARHHPHCLDVLTTQPVGRVVINHCGMPDFGGDLALWAETMRRYARETSVVTQLSGLIALAGTNWTLAQIRPIALQVLEIFGPSRVMFCSDWPLSIPHGVDYRRWWEIAHEMLDDFGATADDRAEVFGGVARRTYAL